MTDNGGGWKLILEGFARENHFFQKKYLTTRLFLYHDSLILPLLFFLLLSPTGFTYQFLLCEKIWPRNPLKDSPQTLNFSFQNTNAPRGGRQSDSRCLIPKEHLTFTKGRAFIVIAYNVYSPQPFPAVGIDLRVA